jgi:hypothetical protein
MKKLLLGVVGALLLSPVVMNAQKCGHEGFLKKIKANPAMEAAYEQYKGLAELKDKVQAKSTKSTATIYIPVVVHVVLTAAQQTTIGGTAGIIKRIDSQLVVLNRDFQAKNADSTKIPAIFKPLYGNANIVFSLAHRKPNGTSTNGYEIITTAQPSFDGTGGTVPAGSGYSCSDVKHISTGGADAWNTAKYLNIWVCNFDDASLLGVAYPKYMVTDFGLTPTELGVVVNYRAFGKRSAVSDSYITGIDKGRTATHEVGHYLGLLHIWGDDAQCVDDDGVSDTPLQADNNFNCPVQTTVMANCNSTPGGEMWMNYMDYVDDACMVMFSKGQVTRMLNTYPGTLTSDPTIFQWPTDVNTVEMDNEFNIYPNPTNGKININFATVPASLNKITVTNTVGQRVYEQNAANTDIYNIDMTSMSKGVYFVQCHFSEGVVTRKIVLE